MPLLPGTRLGPYEILDTLGGGGMGDVYRARDPRLGREVALKVLREGLGLDRERLRRFAQEARSASALNHPNIVTVHDFDSAPGPDGEITYLAMELVEGDGLRELAAGGPLPLRRALGLVAQIADGLAAAHQRGIVHRDLKLDNVRVTRDGRVKILDFGLAKMFGDMVSAAGASPSATRPGQIWGTPGYMAPEQINGEPIDYRADQFALGVILFELVAGRRPFTGNSPFEAMTAIVRDEPPSLAAVAPHVPDQLAWVVERLLAKAPAERYESSRDLALELARLRDTLPRSGVASGVLPPELAAPAGAPTGRSRQPTGVGPTPTSGTTMTLRPLSPTRSAGARRAVVAVAAAALLAAGAWLGWLLRSPWASEPPRLVPLTHSGSDASADVSPDGRVVAFASERDGRRRIWLKQLAGGSEAPLTGGVDDAPRFSPDGGRLLFSRLEGGRRILYRVAVVGGEERRLLADASAGDWSPDGRRIAFARNLDATSWQLGLADADGGGERQLLRVATNTMGTPAWSPDGRHIAVVTGVSLSGAPSQLHFVAVEGGRERVLPAGPVLGVPATPAWLADSRAVLLPRGTDVRAFHGAIVRFGLDGSSHPLFSSLNVGPVVAIAGPGRVVFDAPSIRSNLREQAIGEGDSRWLTRGYGIDRQPRYSPDGKRLLFSSNRSGNLDLWELELASGALRRITDAPQEDWDPAYVGDGSRIVWSSRRGGNLEIWMAASDGSGARQVSRDGVDAENPSATPDGRWIVYNSLNPTQRGIWRLRADGSEAINLVPGDHGLPEVSPDGAYVLYRTDPGPNRFDIQVVRLADGRRVHGFDVSRVVPSAQVRGVVQGRARWLPDGSAIVFVATDERGVPGLWAQDFVPGEDTAASRRPLAGFDLPGGAESFAFSPDGRRLTIATGEQTVGLVLAEGVAGVE